MERYDLTDVRHGENGEIYNLTGEWTSATFWRSLKGWIIELNSKISEDITDCKVLVYYCKDAPMDMDLDKDHNDYMSNAEWLAQYCFDLPHKILRKGFIVE